jgi:hypothetical protein
VILTAAHTPTGPHASRDKARGTSCDCTYLQRSLPLGLIIRKLSPSVSFPERPARPHICTGCMCLSAVAKAAAGHSLPKIYLNQIPKYTHAHEHQDAGPVHGTWRYFAASSFSLPTYGALMTTLPAGRLTPAASVDVATSTVMVPSEKPASISSRSSSVSPAWWNAMPSGRHVCVRVLYACLRCVSVFLYNDLQKFQEMLLSVCNTITCALRDQYKGF